MSFANDIALLSNSHAGMQENLKILQSHCDKTGLDIDVNKTKGFHFTCKRKTFMYNHAAKWRIRNETIKYIPPGDTERYLGARIDPWAGVKESEWEEKLKTWVEGLRTVPLKPTQTGTFQGARHSKIILPPDTDRGVSKHIGKAGSDHSKCGKRIPTLATTRCRWLAVL
ncbi:hypothetical protein chiPu_0027940 [Chiloscyllium punctatum]|uniref:Reverse transcriptase domain-containing protein n=1 Tax=Chiloscyllium punctatum TaxID=137246 RepID=A0A401TM41_CHIPU|nr:hypothetical protein [Chiloscyllium punctatum]